MIIGGMTISKPSADTALIVGATSSLAQALCRRLAVRGYTLALAGRDAEELATLAADLRVRSGKDCYTVAVDFLDPQFSVVDFLKDAGDFTHLVLAAGDMGSGDLSDVSDIAYVTHVNFTVPAQIAATAAAWFAEKGKGTIVFISSVAGDRGRAKVGVYGSAKAALSNFASALRNAYTKKGVHILTAKPGFTDTPMTWGMTSPLMAGREAVAEKIVEAMEKKKDVVYAPWFWRFIMLVIGHIPERIFKRLSI